MYYVVASFDEDELLLYRFYDLKDKALAGYQSMLINDINIGADDVHKIVMYSMNLYMDGVVLLHKYHAKDLYDVDSSVVKSITDILRRNKIIGTSFACDYNDNLLAELGAKKLSTITIEDILKSKTFRSFNKDILKRELDLTNFLGLYQSTYPQYCQAVKSEPKQKQAYTSKDTSISVVNRVYTHMDFKPKSVILDYGGGKYDKNIEYMQTKACKVVIYDPYNRSAEYNQKTLAYIQKAPVRYIVCSNVLNVIKENNIVADVLGKMQSIQRAQQGECDIYIAVYEGDKSGKGKTTQKGYQRNEKITQYLGKIYRYFDKKKVEVKDNIIICHK